MNLLVIVVLLVMLLVVVGCFAAVAGMDLVIFDFRQKNTSRGSQVRLILLPLITLGLLREAPKKSKTVNTMGCC